MTTSTASNDVTPAAVEPPRARRRLSPTWIGVVVAAAVLGLGLLVPYIVSDTYTMGLALDAVLLSMLALGIGFLARHLGLISLGHTAFFGGAAYMVGIATVHWGWGPTEAVLAAVVAGALLSVVMGVLVVRASGMGFLMLTLALSQALYQLTVQTSARPITGAFDGLQVTYDADKTFLGLPQSDVMNAGLFWPFAWGALVIAALVLWLVGRSRFGTLLEGIRENEERMRFSGYDTFRPRLIAFVLSGTVAALGGALFAINASYVSPEVLGFLKAGDSLIATIVGGLGTLLGPVVGASLYVYAQANFNTGGNLHLYTGIALILVLVFLPGGLTGGIQKLWRRVRSRKDGSA
jgi:branched-chain amino acid transport system permease protein